MKRFQLIILTAFFGSPLFAQDASTTWRDIIRKCARSDQIGKQTLFFGVSNTIGPGSVWRVADDRSIRLMFELSDAFPNDADQAKLIKNNNIVACSGNASTSWNLKFGLPFSTGATRLSLDIGALLGRAHHVSVSITGWALDQIKETPWKAAFQELGPTNKYAIEVLKPGRLIAENAIKVTGFKAAFDYNTDFGADVQAKYSGAAFTLGNSSAGTGGPATSGANSTAGSPGGTTSPGSGNANAPSTNASTGSCSGGAGTGSTVASSGGSPGTGSATLHVGFTSSRQIVICADGPFYLIAAYSTIKQGEPTGMVPTGAHLMLSPLILPEGAVAESDREPKF